MNTPIRYITVAGSSTTDLDENVNELLEDGYALHGNPYFAGDPELGFCQAMIKKVQEPDKMAGATEWVEDGRSTTPPSR
jgi:hypothetical protein